MDGNIQDTGAGAKPVNALDAEQAGDAVTVSFTILRKEGETLTKAFAADGDGVRKSDVDLTLTRGTARVGTFTGTPAEVLEQLQGGLEKLAPNKALVTGLPPIERDDWTITTKEKADLAAGKIARCKDHFTPAAGPALLALDFDLKGCPAEIAAKIEAAGGLFAAVMGSVPELAGAAWLIRPSASSHVRNVASGKTTGNTGEHWYAVTRDGRDAEAFARRLNERLEAAGLCWGEVRGNGTVQIKTPLDAGASAPHRIMYEAKPILGKGLDFHPDRKGLVRDGGLHDPGALGELTPEQAEARSAHRAAAEVAVSDRAARVRREWKEEQIQRQIERGVDPDRARASAESTEGDPLPGDLEILFDDGTAATVRDIVEQPKAYHGKTCRDPFEPDYQGGKPNVAVIRMDHPAHIFSHAHGGIRYALADAPDHFFEVVELEGVPAVVEGAETLPAKKPRPSRLVLSDDLRSAPPDWLVSSLFERDAISVAFGDSTAGKTFVAVDIALCVALGVPFHGHAVRQGAVIYVNGEGHSGFARRLDAWEKHRGISRRGAPFAITRGSVGFLDKSNVEDLARAIDEFAAVHGLPALIVLDTLARNFGPGNESDTADMTRFLAAVDALRRRYPGSHVLVVHHTGLADKNRMRGSYSLFAGADQVYRIDHADGVVTMVNQKMKDGPEPAPIAFKRVEVFLGFEDDGKPYGSLALEQMDMPKQVKTVKLSPTEKAGTSALAAVRARLGISNPRGAVPLDEWRKEFRAAFAGTEEAERQAWGRARKGLAEKGMVEIEEDRCSEVWPDEA